MERYGLPGSFNQPRIIFSLGTLPAWMTCSFSTTAGVDIT
ncbi:hypothetical protein L910_4795 [Vibrio fluvialis PG41]|uniref:Uncharacterized protein n=1 Tax=Vibrio fluvialis PG41 TaxID=1336752 RepID=S7I3G0_VIBFL|nr:hypothetical protein L910_4795 [Vibrio fluvialis PG41]